MITDASNWCRYSRSRREMWIGTAVAVLAGTALVSALGAFAAAVTLGREDSAFDAIALVGATQPTVLALLVLFILLDNWTVNVLNLYTGGMAVANMAPRIGRFWATLSTSAAGVLLSIFPALVNGYTDFMTYLGVVFAPIAGVLVADYLVIKHTRVDVPALYERSGRYSFLAGVNPVAVAWVALGVALTFALPDAVVPNIAGMLVSAAGYVVTYRLASRRVPALVAAAEAPADRAGSAEAPADSARRAGGSTVQPT